MGTDVKSESQGSLRDWVVDLGDTWSESLSSLDEAREMQAMWPGSVIYRREWTSETT